MTLFRYRNLAEQLRTKIRQHQWLPGERLPAIRKLCQQYQLSLATVQHALHELEAEGLIEAQARQGYFVRHQLVTSQPSMASGISQKPAPVSVPELFLDIMNRSAAFDILPDGPAMPLPHLTILQRQISRAMRRNGAEYALHYDEPRGLPALRAQLANHYRTLGMPLETDDFCITAGCQHALFLALKACCQPGDTVAVEHPAFYGTLQLLQQLQLKVLEIPTTATGGMDVTSLEIALEKWPVKACLVTPAYATPTGACMPFLARQHLIALANQYQLAVIEDDIYGDLGFNERPLPLKSLDTEQRVILCSSFSKALSRDLRIGWISAGRWQQQVIRLKLTSHLASSQAVQQGLADFLAEGHYKRHLQRFRIQLQHQRDQLINALQQYWQAARFSVPHGGLALWLELNPDINCTEAYGKCLEKGIILTPGALFSGSEQFRNCLRLSFANPMIGRRLVALQQLAAILEGSCA